MDFKLLVYNAPHRDALVMLTDNVFINGLFRPLLLFFCLFKQTLQFLLQVNVKNVHPGYGAGIQTLDLQNTSLLP